MKWRVFQSSSCPPVGFCVFPPAENIKPIVSALQFKAHGADVAARFFDYGRPLAIADWQLGGFWFGHIVFFSLNRHLFQLPSSLLETVKDIEQSRSRLLCCRCRERGGRSLRR